MKIYEKEHVENKIYKKKNKNHKNPKNTNKIKNVDPCVRKDFIYFLFCRSRQHLWKQHKRLKARGGWKRDRKWI